MWRPHEPMLLVGSRSCLRIAPPRQPASPWSDCQIFTCPERDHYVAETVAHERDSTRHKHETRLLSYASGMSATNDNAPSLPTPSEFSMLVAELLGAHHGMLEDPTDVDAMRAMEAVRMRVHRDVGAGLRAALTPRHIEAWFGLNPRQQPLASGRRCVSTS